MKYIRLTIAILFVLLIVSLSVLASQYKKLQEEYEIAAGNTKILLQDKTDLYRNIGILQLHIDELEYSNDSVLQKLNKARKELKIKDKDIKYLQYMATKIEKKDSIIIKRDTIFVKDTHVDTLIKDKWYNLQLKLDYPNSVVVNPKFISEQYVVVHANRETIRPPKKCRIGRWFQKKHTVIRVEIKEENPYIKQTNNQFVKILDRK